MNNIQSALIELEKGFWKAAGSNGSYYKEHFLNEGVMVLPFKGGILNKEQTIAAVTQAAPWHSFEINNHRLLSISENYIVLIYEATGLRDNAPRYAALVSSHYKQASGRWQLAFHQQTPIS